MLHIFEHSAACVAYNMFRRDVRENRPRSAKIEATLFYRKANFVYTEVRHKHDEFYEMPSLLYTDPCSLEPYDR